MNARQSDKSETLWIYLWLICLGQAILEMRAVQCTDPSIWDSFSSETRPGLCQNIPMCCLSDVLDPCPVRGILALSAKGDWWIKHLSGKKKKKTQKKRNNWAHCLIQESLSSISDLVFFFFSSFNDILELGQHWKNCGVLCCVLLTYIAANLKVRAEKKQCSCHWLKVLRSATCNLCP